MADVSGGIRGIRNFTCCSTDDAVHAESHDAGTISILPDEKRFGLEPVVQVGPGIRPRWFIPHVGRARPLRTIDEPSGLPPLQESSILTHFLLQCCLQPTSLLFARPKVDHLRLTMTFAPCCLPSTRPSRMSAPTPILTIEADHPSARVRSRSPVAPCSSR